MRHVATKSRALFLKEQLVFPCVVVGALIGCAYRWTALFGLSHDRSIVVTIIVLNHTTFKRDLFLCLKLLDKLQGLLEHLVIITIIVVIKILYAMFTVIIVGIIHYCSGD